MNEFSNGYRFREMYLDHSSVVDAEGNSLRDFLGLILRYEKEGAPEVTLSVQPAAYFSMESSAPIAASREVQGVTVNYYHSSFLVVPEGYRPSPEEKALVDAGQLQISYGSDEREEHILVSAIFTVDGTLYDLLCFADHDAETMLRMAEELITEG